MKQVWSAVAGLAVIGILASGCATPRASLGTSQNACFFALPVAADAVSHQGHFAGIHRLVLAPGQTLPLPAGGRRPITTTTASSSTTTPGTKPAKPRGACLVAFKGVFDPARISLLRGPNRTGRYAIVAVGLRTHKVVAVYLADALPRTF
jgi:hypothetical protein